MKCDRCSKETQVHILSMFNLDEICLECKAKEREHPEYKAAVQADELAIRSGNFNFKGIGLPQHRLFGWRNPRDSWTSGPSVKNGKR